MDASLLLDNLNLRQQNYTRCELWRTSCSFNDDFPWTKALLNFHVCWGEPPAKQDFRSLGASCWEYEQGDEHDIDWLNSVDGFVDREILDSLGRFWFLFTCLLDSWIFWMNHLGGPDLAIINHNKLIMTISVCFQSSIGSLRIEEYSPYITWVGWFWQKSVVVMNYKAQKPKTIFSVLHFQFSAKKRRWTCSTSHICFPEQGQLTPTIYHSFINSLYIQLVVVWSPDLLPTINARFSLRLDWGMASPDYYEVGKTTFVVFGLRKGSMHNGRQHLSAWWT